jgi:hypothetical protein
MKSPLWVVAERRGMLLNVSFVASIQGKVSEWWVSSLGIVAMVSTPSDLHQIYLQHHGRNTTVLQN